MSSIPAWPGLRSALLLSIALAAQVAAAQSDDPGEQARGRVLNGHVFMPAEDVRGPLVTTSFQSGFLVAAGTTTASWQVGDQTLSGNFEYAGVGAVLGYEYAFLDSLSVRMSLSELIYSGITGRSAIVIGSQLHGGIGGGATFSLPVADSLRVGVLLDASYAPNLGLTVGSAIRSVVESCNEPEGCNVDGGQAFELKNVFTLEPAVAASWAPVAPLGVTANIAYVYADQTVNGTESTGHALRLGTAIDFDFKAISSVPVGLQAQFSWLAPTGEGMQHVTDLGGGVFYTGRPNLALGAQLIARRFAVTPEVDVTWTTYLTEISMRYYW